MDNQAVGRRVWEAVGGQKNVKSLVHCATRLRFRLKDESLADTQKLKRRPGRDPSRTKWRSVSSSDWQ